MHLCRTVVVHVASPNAPMRCEVNLEESGQPVLLILLGCQVLKLLPCRECRSPLVKEVSHYDVREPCGLEVTICRVILLHRVKENHLELLCPLLLDVEAEVTEKKVARLCCTFLSDSIISREVRMALHSSLAAELSAATEVLECIELSAHLTAVECDCRLVTYLRVIWVKSSQHVCVLSTHCRNIRDEVCSRERP